MLRIVWKSFQKNLKTFFAFFASTIMAISVLFLMMYVQEALENIRYTGVFVNQLSGELELLVRTVNSFFVIVGTVVVAYSVQFYIYSRMKDYGMMKILGIKRKDMNQMLVLEYGIGCTCSCGIGIGVGQIVSFGIGKILEELLDASFMHKIEMTKVYKYTAIICVLMTLLAVIVISIILSERELSTVVKGTIVKEKRIVSSKALAFLVFGLATMTMSIVFVFRCENLYIQNYLLLIFCVGFGIAFIFGAGYFFEKYRNSQSYFRSILVWNDLYHYFNSNKYMVLIQTFVGIIIIYFSSFFLSGIMTNEEKTYPNDILCIYEEGDKLKEEIKKKWGEEGDSFSFIEVNPDFSEGRIGISESQYNQNFGIDVELAGNEIISICDTVDMQSLMKDQDTRESKELYFENIEEGENYIVKSERTENYLGFDFGGMVIFPDTVFEKVRQGTGRQREILFLDVKESKLNEITAWLKKQPKNRVEAVFSKQIEMENGEKEKVLAVVVLAVVDFAILFFGMFIQWLKNFSNLERMHEKYLFLQTIGIQEKERRKILIKEVSIPIRIEIFCAVFCGGVFSVGRELGNLEFKNILETLSNEKEKYIISLIVIIGYWGIQYAFLILIRRWNVKKICDTVNHN